MRGKTETASMITVAVKGRVLQCRTSRKTGLEDGNQAVKLKIVRDADWKSFLTINECGWVSYEELWRSRRVLSVKAEADNTLRVLHNSSYDTKVESIIVLLFIQNNS